MPLCGGGQWTEPAGGGVVNEDVEPAEFLFDEADHVVDVFLLADVGPHAGDVSPHGGDLCRDFVGFAATGDVVDDDVGARLGGFARLVTDGEDAAVAVFREVAEETGIASVSMITEIGGPYTYDLPDHLIGKVWGGKYRGQRQRWFALRFSGPDSEVNLTPPGHKPEFDQWRWAAASELIDLIVPFKRDVYRAVLADAEHKGLV